MTSIERPRTVPPAERSARRVTPSVRVMRSWFGAASRVAPGMAERQAARLFLTPRRRRHPEQPAIPGRSARTFTIELEPHRLAAWSWGDGPLALLVHGWEGSAAHMVPAASRLADLGFRVVAVDMPGHGRSSGTRTSLVEWLAVLGALPAALGAPRAVVGHSFGATALALALADGLPARRAVLVAPPLGPLHFVDRARRFIGLPEHRVPGMLRRLAEMVGRDIAEFDTSRAAGAVQIPGLILHDPADPDVPWSHAEALARAWPASRLHACAGVGHYQILRDPAALETVSAFVGSDADVLARAG